MIAEKGNKKWEILDWDLDIEFVSGLKINIQQLLEENQL